MAVLERGPPLPTPSYPWTVAACAIALAACHRPQETPKGAPAAALTVEFSGCAAVAKGPVCELGPERTVRLWVASHEDARPAIFAAGPVTTATPVRLEDGWYFERVVVPAEAQEVRVEAGGARFALHVATPPIPAWVATAKTLREEGKLEEARAALEPGLTATSEAERVRALGTLARIELAQGTLDASGAHFREAIALARTHGRVSDAAEDTFALTYLLAERSRRYAEAHAALDANADLLGDYPEGRARDPYYRALIARETGDLRAGLALLRAAQAGAARVGDKRLAPSVRQGLALFLNELGRFDEALAIQRSTTTADLKPCDRVLVAINHAYTMLLQHEQAGDDPALAREASGVLEEARPLVDGGRCGDTLVHGDFYTELALAKLDSGRADEAAAHLARSREILGTPSGVLAVWSLELEGRIALARHAPNEALAAFDKEARLAEGSLLIRGLLTATVGRAGALESLGKLDAASKEYAKAEALLDDESLIAPLGEGRGTFVGGREKSARRWIDLLLRQRRTREAMVVARASSARVLGSIERAGRLASFDDVERARWEEAIGAYRRGREALDAETASDWRLSAKELEAQRAARHEREAHLRAALDDALVLLGKAAKRAEGPRVFAPPPHGTLNLVYHPVQNGWVGFAEDDTGVTSAPLGTFALDAPKATLGEKLLGPFHDAIARASRVRIMAYGSLRTVDFHALDLTGEPLIARVDVEYGLDLAPRAIAPKSSEAARALVVADPTDDLAAARAEGAMVRDALQGTMPVDFLAGREATSRAFTEHLGGTSLLHYAGHGVFAGNDGWESSLPLAIGSHLSIGDVLALPRVPEVVVLSACEGARATTGTATGGFGLAHAFVAAGSSMVIGPVRPVGDRLAADVTRRLYEEARTGNPDSIARALRDALLAIRKSSPEADWAAFRALTP